MTWLPTTAPGATPLDAVFGLVPDAYERFRELYGSLWDDDALSPAVVELCRLRVATILRCDGELAVRYQDAIDAGCSTEQVESLAAWPTAACFDAVQRAALAFAEQYVLDPHELTDAHFDALHAHFDDRALATLTLAVAMSDALGRFRVALHVAPLPGAGADHPAVVPGPTTSPRSLP
jgi:AhpD family alkylhydroperoxidase